MSEWMIFIPIPILAAVAILIGLASRSRDASYEVIEEDPCETCLRWDECNGVDDGCPLKNKG